MFLPQRGLNRAVVLPALILSLAGPTAKGSVTFDWVTVGDPRNAADATGLGSVARVFRISKYEVTNAQYAKFLNAKDPNGANALGLYNASMGTTTNGGIAFAASGPVGVKYAVKPGRANNPVTFVSWYDAVRFANWLHNGQGAGDTETGAYTLMGGTTTPSNGKTVIRNAAANIFVPTEDEWYKAAYYKGDGVNAGYWTYATQSDSQPVSVAPPGAANAANVYGTGGYATTGSTMYDSTHVYVTDVGAYDRSVSAYGTFDQTGNVWEWNEGAYLDGSFHYYRGGSWGDTSVGMRSSDQNGGSATAEYADLGFRVASVPEPGGVSTLVAGILVVVRRRSRVRCA